MRNLFVRECGNYKTSYKKDMKLFGTKSEIIKWLILLIILLTLPLYASNYWVGLLTLCAISAIGAIGLNILTGFTGQISIGVGAFLGVGGYTTAILTTTYGLSFWISLPLAGIVTALVGGLFGIPSLRLKGLYLAIATLAAQVIITFIISRWDSVTGGTAGMVLSRPVIGNYVLTSNASYYYLTIIILMLTVLYSVNLLRTRVGRAFLAVRDRDIAAQIMGINLFYYKVLAFIISSFFVGIAGALLAHYTMIVSPELYNIQVSIQYLAMVLIGGLGSILGSILGAIFITLLPVGLTSVVDLLTAYMPDLYQLFSAFKEFVFGLAIILFLIFEPGGLAHIWQNIKNYFRVWPFSY
ncbi:branched-chain amino acid ABC transporter permease [Ureibacillus sp. FSL W7-1570]|uniref:branched-chain amino acid ABC transporter permease n=1 Tax=Ureibacillus sp. FSL W7-1570 TaxID=2954593 RepID=UPI00315AABEF